MKFLLLSILYVSISYSQSNYWEYHSLDNCTQLVKTDNEVFYAVSFPNILKSTDYGVSWDTIYTSGNLSYLTYFSIFVDTNYIPDDRIIVKQDEFYHITLDGGHSWNPLTNLPGEFDGLTFNSQGNIYFMIDNNILFSSSDNGITWNIVYDFPSPMWSGSTSDLVSDINNNLYTTYSYYWEHSPGIYYQTTIGLQSMDGGYGWHTVFDGEVLIGWIPPEMTLITTATGDVFAYTLYNTFLHFNGSTTYEYSLEVPVKSALVNNLDHIYCSGWIFVYSTDQGNSWITDTSGFGGENFPSSVVIDTLGILYVSTDEGIFRSNYTTSFFFDSLIQFQETPIEDTTYRSVILRNHFSYDVLIDSITMSIPEFHISENYNNTISANDSINIVVGFTPEEMQQYQSEIILYSEFISSRSTLSGTGINSTNVEESKIIVDDFVLKQNYPNPFNSQTTIEYFVPERTHTQITVYDYLGRIVKILFDGIKESGKYIINFNADDLASGIYFYRMQAGNFLASRKLILLK